MKNDKTDNHEQIFWEEIDRLFPDMIKAIASLSKKSYLSITNLRTGITWWSERAMDYFGMKENYTIRSMEKANRKIHPDDVATFKRGFKERVDGKNLDTAWEYRIQDGDSYNRFNAMARVLYDEQKQPFIIIIRYDNYGISDEVDSVTGLYTEPALNRCITQLLDNTRPAALLKIGLDQFSHINVMYGAAFADKILNKVAQSLLHMVRNIGYAYRLSGAKFVLVFDKVSKTELHSIFAFIEDTLANTIAVNGKRIPIKISAGAIFLEPYMKETNAVRSRLTYAQNHSRYEHHGDLVIFNDEICGNNEKQFELIGLIHQCATSHFEGFRLFYQPIADTKTGKIRGMELLPVVTVLQSEKKRCQTKGKIEMLEGCFHELFECEYQGYEIHMGQTSYMLNNSVQNVCENVISENGKNVYGSYVHGLFDHGNIAYRIVKILAEKKGIRIKDGVFEDYQVFKEKQYDKLADTLRLYLDMEEIYGMLREAHLE